MGDTIGARLAIEGEREFKQALQSADAQLKALSSSLDLSAAKFAGQENSMEALSAQYSILEKQYDTQAKKVELIRQRLERSAKEYGENSNQTLHWQTTLNRAETQLEKMRKKLQDTGESLEAYDSGMEEAKKETDGFSTKVKEIDEGASGLGDVLDQLGNKFGISLPGNMRESLNGMAKVDAGSLALVGGITAVTAAVVKAEKALVSMTKEAAAFADEILTTATITGISAEKLQEYQYAAELMDVSVETITGSQTKLIRSMQDAQQGTEAQIDAFNRLGVSYQNNDGTLRNAQDVYWDVVDALGQMTNETERDAVAMELLGKSARDLNPLIEAGSERMEELAKEAHNVGYVLNEEQLDALGAVDDAMQRFHNTTEATKNQLATEFAPYLEESTQNLTDFVGNLGTSLKQSGLVDAFGMLLNTFSGMLSPADDLARNKVPALTMALRPLAQVLAGISSTVELLASFLDIRTLLTKPGDYVERLYTATGIGYQYGYKNQYQQLLDMYAGTDTNYRTDANGYGQYYANGKYYANKDAYLRELYAQSGYGGTFESWKIVNGYNASGNHNWRGGYSWVGENGPELVRLPKGSSILSAQESREAVGDTYVTVTVDAKNVKEFNDVIRIVENARMNARKRG